MMEIEKTQAMSVFTLSLAVNPFNTLGMYLQPSPMVIIRLPLQELT